MLKVWNAATAKCVYTQKNRKFKPPPVDESNTEMIQTRHSIVNAFMCSNSQALVTVTYEHNIILHKLHDFSVDKQVKRLITTCKLN